MCPRTLKTFLCIAGNWLVRLAQPVYQMSVFLTKLFQGALKLFRGLVVIV
jgi:hypothetical protein